MIEFIIVFAIVVALVTFMDLTPMTMSNDLADLLYPSDDADDFIANSTGSSGINTEVPSNSEATSDSPFGNSVKTGMDSAELYDNDAAAKAEELLQEIYDSKG